MRMPRERPSKRLWKTIAVTREAGWGRLVRREYGGKGGGERTEVGAGGDGEGEAYYERVDHDAHLQDL